ncbi:BTAD domain-containing putative transcriptional regulator [Kitasatospora sp. CM 4170]|uniref:BTAD domain-containing putative transcriptional regulator n=1 Tax=Kitasatospora aburaviensis TaxID=67265 RepID=A0ABW1F450_9ACTN|nr:BTAD domain-containing putative transcriptional regulator [Kitasatospora sp. CM 4170]WNM49131.1 BTAD domain-containing putative transcriptional regulator [Kitasatospora sp. CM 4170]
MTTPLLPTTHPAGLSFELLGEVRGWRDGIELPLGAPRQRALLAVLLLRAGSPVGRDHLIDGIWGDATVADGANLVQAYVSKLRRLFEPDRAPRTTGGVLTRVGASYRLSVGPHQCDLGRFERSVADARALRSAGQPEGAERTLAAALDSWSGPALTGVSGPLLDVERARLAELRLAVVEEHAELALQLGGHAWLVPHLLVLTTEHPYRERLWALLMVSLYRGSRQADALAAYQRARHTLTENLGLLPGPELRSIEEAILAGRPDPLVPARPAVPLSLARPVTPVEPGGDPAAPGQDVPAAPAAELRTDPAAGRPHLALVGTTPATVPAPRAAARGPWADGPTRLAR